MCVCFYRTAKTSQNNDRAHLNATTFTIESQISKSLINAAIFAKETETSDSFIHGHTSLYSTTISPSKVKCDSETFLLVVVITKPSAFNHREAYRSTVLSPIISQCMEDTRHVFLIGQSADAEIQTKLEEENRQHNDIVQGYFQDSYQNLTIKSLYLLKWASENCQGVSFVFKLDDDVYAVLEDIRFYLKMKQNEINQYAILGSIFDGVKPIHDTNNKWYVENFNEAVFPRYVSGTAYVLSASLLKPLFEAGINLPFVRLEDVFVTGISARRTHLPVKYHNLPGFQYMQAGLANIAKTDFHSQKTIHGLDSEHLYYLHKKYQSEFEPSC